VLKHELVCKDCKNKTGVGSNLTIAGAM